MYAKSREIISNQAHTHPGLAKVVRKHLASEPRHPIPRHNMEAYQILRDHIEAASAPLVLDSFCGTGLSTTTLAAQQPDCYVVGIDKSAQRLSRRPQHEANNCLFLQADCEDIWALMARDGFTVSRHYLLYPNPWPKSAHLKRRVHGHSGFRALLQLGGTVELRSNWQVYVEEFGIAMHLAGNRGAVQHIADNEPDMTLFEKKYRNSGHLLWRYRGRIAQ